MGDSKLEDLLYIIPYLKTFVNQVLGNMYMQIVHVLKNLYMFKSSSKNWIHL